MKARREFLESDVHHLEVFLVDQRARVREAATALIDVVERVPGGLAEVRGPLLSASGDHDDDAVLDAQGRVDPLKLDPLARLGGDRYARLGEPFSIPRPRV